MTLRRRLLLAVLPLGLLLLLVGGAGGALLLNLGRQSDAILRENYDSIHAMMQFSKAADAAIRAVAEGDRIAYTNARVELQRQFDIEAANVTIRPREPILVGELKQQLDAFVEAGEAGNVSEMRRWHGPLTATATDILLLNQDQMETANRAAQRTARLSLVWFSVGFGVAGMIAVFVIYRVVAVVGRPIRELTDGVRAIRSGDLTHRLSNDASRDEFGELATAFNDMAEQLWLIKQTDYRTLVRTRAAARATIDSFPSPVLVIDPEGKVELANPAAHKLFGVSPSNAWVPPDPLRQPLLDALREQRPFTTDRFDQAIALHSETGERVFLPQVRPIRGDRNDTLGAAVVLEDVTPFRLLDQLKGDFVSTVGHELKTPLTGLRMAVHLLLEEAAGPISPKQTELLVDARDNAERLFNLVEQLLALARLEDRREYLNLQKCAVGELLWAAVDLAAVRAADKAVSIAVEDCSSVTAVAADPVRLGHALDNLLSNAVTYTPSGGRVTLSATTSNGTVTLLVADTGVGIAPEHLPHVFDKFFRVPGVTPSSGTGLGLAIVREIVAAHGGTVSCESTVGVGTTFRIALPAWQGNPQ